MPGAEQDRIDRDKNFAKACIALKGDPRWETMLEFLTVELLETDASNRVLEGTALYRSQGKAQTLEWLLKQGDEAADIMARVMLAQSRLVRERRLNGGILNRG